MDKDTELQLYIRKLKISLMRDMPFYGEMLSHFEIKASENVSTAATNGKVILFNPEFFLSTSEGERNYTIMHELMHILLKHPFRCNGRNIEIWNVASDFVANALLDKILKTYREEKNNFQMSFKKPKGILQLPNYNGDPVEKIYNELIERNKEILEKLLSKFKQIKLVYVERYGDRISIEVSDKHMDLLVELSPDEADGISEQVSIWYKEGIKNWSDDPSIMVMKQQLFILEHAKDLSWKRLLKRFLLENEEPDVSYDHPERKYLHMDMILPGEGIEQNRNHMDDVWAFIDTSGSISEKEKNEFITQLYRICKQFETRVNIGYWDVQMHEIYENVSKEELVNAGSGYCGGTDANAVYDFLDENKPKASVILILTDGYFNAVKEQRIKPYRKKTIVVVSESGDCSCSTMGTIAKL